jgi:RNA polymerase sigma-70 factor (sigma-E family)
MRVCRVHVMETMVEPAGGKVTPEPDQATFEQIYRVEYRPLVLLAFSLTGNRAVAEDLVQEALLRLHKRWSRVVTYDRPGAWLRRVVLHLACSRARRVAAEARALTRLGRERPPQPALPDDVSEFWAAVRRLPRRQAQVLALYYGEDRSVADVAGILGCAEGTVRAHLHQGRQALAARLGVEDHEEEQPG